jgi:hypothetical protein
MSDLMPHPGRTDAPPQPPDALQSHVPTSWAAARLRAIEAGFLPTPWAQLTLRIPAPPAEPAAQAEAEPRTGASAPEGA